MGEYQFRTDPVKNRLYIRLSGFFREAEVTRVFQELDATLGELRSGFDVVTDLTDFKPGSPGSARSLRRGAELVKARGRRRAVRVAGRLVTGLMQFRRELTGVFDEGSTRYARTVEEAEELLDNW
jgi:hypothetical protein